MWFVKSVGTSFFSITHIWIFTTVQFIIVCMWLVMTRQQPRLARHHVINRFKHIRFLTLYIIAESRSLRLPTGLRSSRLPATDLPGPLILTGADRGTIWIRIIDRIRVPAEYPTTAPDTVPGESPRIQRHPEPHPQLGWTAVAVRAEFNNFRMVLGQGTQLQR